MKRNVKDGVRESRLKLFLASRTFWLIVLGVFLFQSAWIALTVRYPMAFDEQFHLGIIRLYAHHLSPFWSGQPSGADQFGALTRDPSYLYQYLMSFPYRLISAFTASETAQVIFLRLINIGILSSALVVFRRLLALLGASAAMRNVVLAFFVLTPVVPFLGAQINYDGLIVLMTALAFSTYHGFRSALRSQNSWKWPLFGHLLLICTFASLVKYAFLPLAAGLTLAVLFDLRYALKNGVKVLPRSKKVHFSGKIVIFALLLVVGLGLFSERYFVNIARYHTPIPECDQVLSVDECQGYAPWARNYMFANWHVETETKDKITYPATWVHKALGETVFTITSRFNEKGLVDYYNSMQLPIPNIFSWVMLVGGGFLSLFYWRTIKRNQGLVVLLSVSALYVLALFAMNLMDYLHLGFPVAIHGRYLLPILPLLYFTIAMAVSKLLSSTAETKRVADSRKAIFAASLLIIFAVEGGGFVTLIMRSHDDWFWPQSKPAQQVNHDAQDVLKYIVIDPKLT
jgi:hypothetical protein